MNSSYFSSVVMSYSNYYPFGMLMPNRHGEDDEYRYGFNGHEKDDEVHGQNGSNYDFGARMYDSRIARFNSRDPWQRKYAWQTPYAYFKNSPISFLDWKGYGGKITKSSSGAKIKSASLSFKYDLNSTKGTDVITMVEVQTIYISETIEYSSGTVITMSSTEYITTTTTAVVKANGEISSIEQTKSINTISNEDPTRAPHYTSEFKTKGEFQESGGVDSKSISNGTRKTIKNLQDYKKKNNESPVQTQANLNEKMNESMDELNGGLTEISLGTAGAAGMATGTIVGTPVAAIFAVISGITGVAAYAVSKVEYEKNPENISVELSKGGASTSEPSYEVINKD